jgi:hypothetical protein
MAAVLINAAMNCAFDSLRMTPLLSRIRSPEKSSVRQRGHIGRRRVALMNPFELAILAAQPALETRDWRPFRYRTFD